MNTAFPTPDHVALNANTIRMGTLFPDSILSIAGWDDVDVDHVVAHAASSDLYGLGLYDLEGIAVDVSLAQSGDSDALQRLQDVIDPPHTDFDLAEYLRQLRQN